jgi:hypothetical protein
VKHIEYQFGNANKSFQFLIFNEAKEELDDEDKMAEHQANRQKQTVSVSERPDKRSRLQRLRNWLWRRYYSIPGTSHFAKGESYSSTSHEKRSSETVN